MFSYSCQLEFFDLLVLQEKLWVGSRYVNRFLISKYSNLSKLNFNLLLNSQFNNFKFHLKFKKNGKYRINKCSTIKFKIYISRQPEMRSNFSSLLLALAMLDIIVILISIWDNTVIKIFHIYSELYIKIFPYIWFPIKEMTLSY